MNEFEAIDLILRRLGPAACSKEVVVGSGDDGAVVRFDTEKNVVVSTDVLVEGRHFPVGSSGDLVGYRSVAVNVSDLSAMGARPQFLTIALTMDHADETWLCQFADGVRSCCLEVGATVIGGNLTRGPKSVAVSALGSVSPGRCLLRSGARPNDDIWLTGKIGASVVALGKMADPVSFCFEQLMGAREVDPISRYFLPIPRVALAIGLRTLATSATDVSDGLASELYQLARHSKCGMQVDTDEVACWEGADLREVLESDDSYELIFTSDRGNRQRILALGEKTDTPVGRIGKVTERVNEVVFLSNGTPLEVGSGYSHF